jgi:seryl-tRNA synthetase
MLDLNYFINHPDDLRNSLNKRFIDSTKIISDIDIVLHHKKGVQSEVEALRSERNRVSKEVGIIKSKGGDITEISHSMKEVGNKIKELEVDSLLMICL